MSLILTLLTVAALTFVLNILIIQSNNFIFMVFRKPAFWMVFMGLFSFIYFFIGSQFENSFNIVWWSAFLAFLLNTPPKTRKDGDIDQNERNQLVDEMYEDMGIAKGRLKYRFGLAAYAIGGLLGWILFYSQTVTLIN